MVSRSPLKYCTSQIWLLSLGSFGLCELFVSLYSKIRRKRNPTILWQNPWRISIIWTKNVPELCHCSEKAWSSSVPFPRPSLCFSSAVSGGHMEGYESKLQDLHASINYMRVLVQCRNP